MSVNSNTRFGDPTMNTVHSDEIDPRSTDGIATLPDLSRNEVDDVPPPVDAVDIAQLYLNGLGRAKLLTADEEKHYGTLARQGDPQAFAIMVESNLRLVVKLCRRYQHRSRAICAWSSNCAAATSTAACRCST